MVTNGGRGGLSSSCLVGWLLGGGGAQGLLTCQLFLLDYCMADMAEDLCMQVAWLN
jgi:hypothetical protein